jgi:hypothetical protein
VIPGIDAGQAQDGGVFVDGYYAGQVRSSVVSSGSSTRYRAATPSKYARLEYEPLTFTTFTQPNHKATTRWS